MFGSEANSDSTNGRDLSNDLKELGENTSNLHITPTHPNTNDENYNIRYLYASESTNRSNLNKSEVNIIRMKEMPGKYLNYQQGEKRKTALSLQLSKQPDVLSEFAELSTNEELRFIHNEYFNSNNRKPLSGRKLIQLGDNSSPYLKCSKFFTESSPSSLIPALEKDANKKDNPYVIQYMMSSMINDSNVWPLVWTCFGRSCKVQFSKDTYFGPVISLDDPQVVDNDIHLQSFQKLWNTQARFLVVDKIIITPNLAKIKICSCLEADRHAGHLNVTLPVNHPFYIENKGWCQVDPRSVFFKTLYRMDVITMIEEESFFKFDDHKVNEPLKEKPVYIDESSASEVSLGPKEKIPRKVEHRSVSFKDPFPHWSNSVTSQDLGYFQKNMYPYQMPQPPQTALPLALGQEASGSSKMSSDTDKDEPRVEQISDSEVIKRPMNGFMLFARTMRLKLISDNPGKDNRVISKLLGEKWKELTDVEKKKFIEQAKQMSEDRLKQNPFCWKRKNNPKKNRRVGFMKPLIESDVMQFYMDKPHNFPSTGDRTYRGTYF